MRSLNPHWSEGQFHARIADLAGVGPGARVLDLGCGRGRTIPHLLRRAGADGLVVAADIDIGGLSAIRSAYSDEITSGRVDTVRLDLAGPLPFADESFDTAVSQNVIECVEDRDGLIGEVHRVLKPRGCALFGHHDFDGVMIASEDRALTRRLVQGYADQTQAWQRASEGRMGRLLPGLMARSAFAQCETETVLFVDLDLHPDSYAKVHLAGIVATAEDVGVTAEDARAWLHELASRSEADAFYYALPWTYVLARKLGNDASLAATACSVS